MKLKEFGPRGGGASKILLCRSATVDRQIIDAQFDFDTLHMPLLGDKPYLFGDTPTEADVALFGALAQVQYQMPGSINAIMTGTNTIISTKAIMTGTNAIISNTIMTSTNAIMTGTNAVITNTVMTSTNAIISTNAMMTGTNTIISNTIMIGTNAIMTGTNAIITNTVMTGTNAIISTNA